jgi:hypothetical protein
MNLIIKDAFKGRHCLQLLKKCRDIIKKCRKSSNIFQMIQVSYRFLLRDQTAEAPQLIKWCETRWTGIFDAFTRLLVLKDSLDQVWSNISVRNERNLNDFLDLRLSSREWSAIAEIRKLLSPIMAGIIALEAISHPTMNLVAFLMASLQQSIKKFGSNNNNNLDYRNYESVKEFLKNLKDSFNQRVKIESLPDIIIEAFYLDIRFHSFNILTDDESLAQRLLRRAQTLVRARFEKKQAELQSPVAESDAEDVPVIPAFVPIASTVFTPF